MPDEFYLHTCFAIELLFERENTKRLREAPPHHANSPRSPGPELRANIIHVADTMPAQLPGQPQVETGKVRQNRKWRLSASRLRDEMPHRANQRGQVAQNFRNAHDRNF